MPLDPQETRGPRPYRRCPEPACGYSVQGIRTITAASKPWYQPRAELEVELIFPATSCPRCGNNLVSECQQANCKSAIYDPDDVYCPKCGTRYWWRAADDVNRGIWQSDENLLERIGRLSVYVTLDSLAHLIADAVVSCDNELGSMRSRSAAALKSQGGDEIEAESMTKQHALGGAWKTNAGKLEAKCVIHVALLDHHDRTEAEILSKAINSSLAVADASKLESMVYPALGTGRAGFNMQESVHISRASIQEYVQSVPDGSLSAVGFALYSPPEFASFKSAYEAIVDVGSAP